MRETPDFRNQRKQPAVLALGVVLGFVLLWRVYLAPTVASIQTTREEIGSERLLLERELALTRQSGALADGWAVVSANLLARAPGLLPGQEPGGPAAALEAYVRGRAGEVGVQVVFPSGGAVQSDTTGLIRVMHEVRADTDLEGALALLHGIERGPKLIMVSELNLLRSAVDLQAGGSAPEHLELHMIVAGWAMAPEGFERPAADEPETNFEALR